MSNYDILLAEAKSTITGTAKHYVPKLYDILTNEEGKTPQDARDIIEDDLKLYWSRAVIRRHLPTEAKDENKVKAGEASAEAKKELLVSVDGKSTELNPEPPTEQYSGSSGSEEQEQSEDPKDIEIQFQKEKIAQLEDALHQTQQFKPATALQPQDDDINTVTLRAGIGAIGNMIRMEIPKLENRGWKIVEVRMRSV